MIPFINRTIDATLSDELDVNQIRVTEVIDEFKSQCDDFTDLFEAIVLMAPGRFRVTCKSARKVETVENHGLCVRGCPVEFKPVSSFTWVHVSRLSYGVPEEEIRKVLGPFGQIKVVRQEQYSNVYTGVRNVLMNISSEIPPRVRIAGHWCVVHYKGQKKVCFKCHQVGHISTNCPPRPEDTNNQDNTNNSGTTAEEADKTRDPKQSGPTEAQQSNNTTSVVINSTNQDLPLEDPTPQGDKNGMVIDLPIDVTVEDDPPLLAGKKRSRSPALKLKTRRSKKDRKKEDPVQQSEEEKNNLSPSSSSEEDESGNEESGDENSQADRSGSGVSMGDEIDSFDLALLFPETNDEDDGKDTDTSNSDYPLTQLTPEAPVVRREAALELRPEDSQASEETTTIRNFFANFENSLSPSRETNTQQ